MDEHDDIAEYIGTLKAGEGLSDLMAPLDLGWKARSQAELALMADLHPLLTQRAAGRDISGLSAYDLRRTHTKT